MGFVRDAFPLGGIGIAHKLLKDKPKPQGGPVYQGNFPRPNTGRSLATRGDY